MRVVTKETKTVYEYGRSDLHELVRDHVRDHDAAKEKIEITDKLDANGEFAGFTVTVTTTEIDRTKQD